VGVDDAAHRPAQVVVVGAGIAGLAAALALRERSDGTVAVTVLEGSPTIGGKLASTEVAGIRVDAGAEAMRSGSRRPPGSATCSCTRPCPAPGCGAGARFAPCRPVS
jgi:monoamine oxidase